LALKVCGKTGNCGKEFAARHPIVLVAYRDQIARL
jgi:hypothetical protein